eukprot:Skav227298  [mRNA]  locus=scaffold2645:95140:99516:- [translate_table: standard]
MRQPGGAAHSSMKARSLFPLPYPACVSLNDGGCRTVRRRKERIRHLESNVKEVIWALNWMAGCKDDDVSQPCSPMQDEVLQRVDGLVKLQKPSGCIPSPEGALSELLHGASPYDFKPVNESLASYRAELVSVPSDIHGCPDLADILPCDDRRFLEEKSELMLRRGVEAQELDRICTPYWDPKLKYNQKAYQGLVRKLDAIGYFTYTTEPACEVGVFFVWKSSRTKLRMITDARRANACFHDPPGVNLMTGEGIGRIEVELEGATWMTEEVADALSIFVGLSDVRDCFHRMRVPRWLSKFFAWRPVPAKVVGLTGTMLDGRLLGPLDPVFPCAGSLCQGFSWSLYFAQRANESVCRSMPLLADAGLVNDRGGPLVLRVGSMVDDKPHFYVYVDNLGVVGTDAQHVQRVMCEMQETFDKLGLDLHACEISSGYTESLGCVVEGEMMRSRINPKRLWKVHQGILGLLRRGKSSGRALEVVIGHATFCGLMNRWMLSTFHAVYGFIHRHYYDAVSFWPSVVDELRAFAGLLFMNVQDWWRQWNRAVTSSDASLTGFGVCESWWEKGRVAAVGRLQERSRFRRLDSHSARESALGAAGLHFDGTAWTKFSSKAAEKLREAGWGLSESFAEVPAPLLKRKHWKPKLWGKWKFNDNIVLLEARGVLKAIKRLAMTRYGHGIRHLHLCDNLGVVLAVERCRSKNFKLLAILRKIGAICMSRNIFLSIRWIPSELNVADEPSRIHDSESSKLLVDLVDDDFSLAFPPQAAEQHGSKTHPHSQQQCQPAHSAAAALNEEDKGADTAKGNSIRCKEGDQPGAEPRRVKFFEEALDGEEGGVETASQDREGAPRHGWDDSCQGQDTGGPERLRTQHLIRMAGRAKRREAAYLAKSKKKASSGACSNGHGDGAKSSRSGGSLLACEGPVQEAHAGVGHLFSAGAMHFEPPSHDRQGPGEALQCKVSGRRREPLRGLLHGSLDGSTSHLWETWVEQSTSSLEEFEGMEKAMPISLEACVPPPGLVWNQLADDGTWALSEGFVQPPPGLDIPQAWDIAWPTPTWIGSPDSTGDWALVSGDIADRDKPSVEDRGQGRQHPSRFIMAPIHRSASSQLAARTKRGQGMGLQLRRVPDSVPTVLQGTSPELSTLPSPTQWSKHRSSKSGTRAGRSEKEGLLVDKKIGEQVRESWQTGSNLAQAECQHTDELSCSRAPHRGNHARPRLSSHRSAQLRDPGRYVADFFSGSGGVARAARKAGFSTREWELLHGEEYDLTKPCVLWKIHEDIKHGKIIAAMLAPPCSSFSPARDRTRVIRTRQFPWGLQDLPEHEVAKVKLGNRCFRSAVKIIEWLDYAGIPWILENPHSSKCWYLPPIKRLLSLPHVRVSVCDFCQYGTKWRKRTRFVSGNLDECDLGRIQCRCHGKPGWCSRTGRKHFQLTGSNRHGIPWTRVAQPYPAQLCHHLAHALTAYRLCVPH